MRTEAEIVRQGNALAREFARLDDWEVPEGYRFDTSDNPRARVFWQRAVLAFDVLQQTDLENAAAEVGGEDVTPVPAPCPFCGHTEPFVTEGSCNFYVSCRKCTAVGPGIPLTDVGARDAAIEGWNRRSAGT